MAIADQRFYTSDGFRKEIDLRQEMEDTLSGTSTEIAKAYKVLVRRFRLDSGDRKIECVCNQNGEGSKDPQCNFCLGEGYYWDEEFEDSFKMEIGSESAKARRLLFAPQGILYPQLTRFFFRYNADVIQLDKIIEMEKDTEGDLIVPHRRGTEWRIHEVEEKRSDTGRLEFIVAYCSKENIHYYTRRRSRSGK
jgi:hypothetical protein